MESKGIRLDSGRQYWTTLIRQGENRPKEANSYSTMGISVTEVTAAEINHYLVCAFIEVSAVNRFCCKPNLAVLKILYVG